MWKDKTIIKIIQERYKTYLTDTYADDIMIKTAGNDWNTYKLDNTRVIYNKTIYNKTI